MLNDSALGKLILLGSSTPTHNAHYINARCQNRGAQISGSQTHTRTNTILIITDGTALTK